jgi:hypothetical protein
MQERETQRFPVFTNRDQQIGWLHTCSNKLPPAVLGTDHNWDSDRHLLEPDHVGRKSNGQWYKVKKIERCREHGYKIKVEALKRQPPAGTPKAFEILPN